jgi:beta-glucanase (GH16 family)
LVRINVGGGQFTDSRGLVWAADEFGKGGSVHSVGDDISNTHDPQLFQTERWGNSSYDILMANGSYVLTLYFAQTSSASGPIDVTSGDQTLLSNFSVEQKVGRLTADAETFDVDVTDKTLTLAFSGADDVSSIAGIEVLRVDADSVVRLNSGGNAYTDTRGLVWNADDGQNETGDSAGKSITSLHAVSGTNNAELYQTQRLGMSGYAIKVPDGTYVLKLYFAEIDPASGPHVFDVYNGKELLLGNFNVEAKVGDYAADVEQSVVTVAGGELNLSFVSVQGSPSIAAIELLSPVSDVAQLTRLASADVQSTSANSSPASAPPAVAPATPSMDGWKLVASDDFNGSSLSSAWGTYSGTGNEGVGVRSPAALSVKNGELDITDQGNVGGGSAFDYSSIYGRYVIRARDDAGTGYGPAILLWPDSESWPEGGEIDIAEMPEGARDISHFTVHYGSSNCQVAQETSGDFTEWHRWTLDWMPDHISLWIDGKLQSTVTKAAAIPHDSMHLAIQNDVGADGHWIPSRNSSTPSTVTLHVDSVQVYQQN